MKLRVVLAACSLFALLTMVAGSSADDSAHKKTAKSSALDQFKQLAGDWVGKMTEDGKQFHDVTVKYTVTSNGSAVVETMGPGTPHEMVTIIHDDGKDLGLTHYCSIGNQPHMKAAVKGDSHKFDFVFTSASNMESDNDMHMHNVTYTIEGKDKLKAVWTTYQDGKSIGTATFELTRKK